LQKNQELFLNQGNTLSTVSLDPDATSEGALADAILTIELLDFL